MAILNILKTGIKIASKTLKSVKGDVQHFAWTGDDGRGNDTFSPTPVTLRALIDPTKRTRYTANGVLVMTYATLTFLDPIADTSASTGMVRENPIDPRDRLVLPDGGTAPIVQTGGFADPATGKGLFNETILGTVVRGQ